MELVVQSASYQFREEISPLLMFHSLTSWIPVPTCLSHMDQVFRKGTLVATKLSSWFRPGMTTLRIDSQVAMNSKSRSWLLKNNLKRLKPKSLIEMMVATWSLTKSMSHAKSASKSYSRMISRNSFQWEDHHIVQHSTRASTPTWTNWLDQEFRSMSLLKLRTSKNSWRRHSLDST